jgi:outer membrane receptor for ferrienterochelin and colicins
MPIRADFGPHSSWIEAGSPTTLRVAPFLLYYIPPRLKARRAEGMTVMSISSPTQKDARTRVGALILAASLGTVGAVAQELEQIVSSASRYAQSTYEAPASVTVITREEIRRFGYRTLAEVLSAAGGMFTSYDRNYTYVTVRGLARPSDINTRVLLLLDGRRLNQPVDDTVSVGPEAHIDLEAIERVEIIRGPGSTLYGTNAFYAVINLVTRTGASVKGVDAQASGGSFDSWYGSLVGGTKSAGGLDVFATASGYDSRGPDLFFPEFDAPETNGGRAVGLDGERFGKMLVRVMKDDFAVEGLFSSRRKEIPTGSYDTLFGDPRSRTDDRGGMLSASYEHAFADLSRVWATASYNSEFYNGHYPYQREGLFSDYTRSRWLTLEGQYQQFVGGQRISVGGEARWNARMQQGGTDAFEDSRTGWVLAAFLQGEFHVAERVTLYAGGRYDHYQTFGGTLSPRVALVAEPAKGTFLKGIYGRAFRAPSAYELYYQDGEITQKPALRLDPERLETFEAALEQRLRPRLKASLSVYHSRVRNGIGLMSDPADGLLVYANGETARTAGVEVALEGQLTPRLFTRASYAFQKVEQGPDNLRPVNSPRHVARLGASLPLFDGQLVPSLEVRYVGARATFTGARADSYTLANLTLQIRPTALKHLELQAKVSNLSDAVYADPGGEEHRQDTLPQDGRTAWVSVRFRF